MPSASVGNIVEAPAEHGEPEWLKKKNWMVSVEVTCRPVFNMVHDPGCHTFELLEVGSVYVAT